MRAVPASSRRASWRVDSCVGSRPRRGRVTWWRSGSTRIAPVVNRTASRPRPRLRKPGEPHPLPGALAVAGRDVVVACPGQPGQPGAVALLGVLRPPWRGLALGLVPGAAEGVQAPRDRHLLAGLAAVQQLLDVRQAPGAREPARTHRGRGGALLARGEVQREPVGLAADEPARRARGQAHAGRSCRWCLDRGGSAGRGRHAPDGDPHLRQRQSAAE
jgi:hypothetical protein